MNVRRVRRGRTSRSRWVVVLRHHRSNSGRPIAAPAASAVLCTVLCASLCALLALLSGRRAGSLWPAASAEWRLRPARISPARAPMCAAPANLQCRRAAADVEGEVALCESAHFRHERVVVCAAVHIAYHEGRQSRSTLAEGRATNENNCTNHERETARAIHETRSNPRD